MSRNCRLVAACAAMFLSFSVPCVAEVSPGLVAHYTFEEGAGGAVKDWSGNGNDGKNLGAKYVKLGEGKGSALAFDTAEACVDCGRGPSLDLTKAVTIEFWFNPQTEIAKGEAGVVGKGKGMDSFMVSYNGKNCWFYINSGGGDACSIATVVGSWQHIAASFDGNELKLYSDGTLRVASKSKSSTINSVRNNLYLRYPVVWGDKVEPTFKCMLDDVRIYNRALSGDEILGHYKEGAAQKGKDVSAFGKIGVTPHVYPLASTLLVEADFSLLRPLPPATKVALELWDSAGKKMLKNYSFTPLPEAQRGEWIASTMAGVTNVLPGTYKAEWILNTQDIPPGTYQVRAMAKGKTGEQVGDSSTTRVELPSAAPWLKANPDVKVLNNLTIQLLDVREPQKKSPQQYKITNPREGWIFISSTASVGEGGAVYVALDGAPKESAAIVQKGRESETAEAMRYLPAGEHALEVRCEGDATLKRLVVRAIPTLIFPEIGYEPCPWLPCYGPYDWAWFKKSGILDNVNMILERTSLPQNAEHCRDWKTQGKRILGYKTVYDLWKQANPFTVESAYNFLTTAPGFADADRDGIMMDEFDSYSMPATQKDYLPLAEAIAKLSRNEAFKGKVFYPYGKGMEGQYARVFMKAISDSPYAFAEEVYLQTQPTEKGAMQYLDARLRQVLLRYQEHYGDFQKHMIMNIGYMSIPKETLNINPNVNWKVFMDMEMNFLANDPVFSGLYGLAWYHVAYADEETLRWSAKLFRHYCIEGKRERLTTDPYVLGHIENGDFEEDAKGWTLEPAEKGGMFVKSLDGYGWLEGRYPRTPQGDTFLVMARSAKSPNRFSQRVKNLQPGRLYAFKMIVADYGDIGQGKSEKKDLAMNIKLEGAELLPTRSIQEVFSDIHGNGPFTDKNHAWMTYRVLHFRAKSAEAKLTVSDWSGDNEPGGPVGQQLMYNFVQIEPYLED